jgi:hypothetical protein
MVMVRRDLYVDGWENNDYFSAYMPKEIPNSEFGFFMNDLLTPLKKLLYKTFVGDQYFMTVLESYDVVYEDGTIQNKPYAFMTRNSPFDPEKCRWTCDNVPDEYRPLDKQKEETVLLKIINDLKEKGYCVQKEQLDQFFNRKVNLLLLELIEGGKSQDLIQRTA